jgi:hypothetical protein
MTDTENLQQKVKDLFEGYPRIYDAPDPVPSPPANGANSPVNLPPPGSPTPQPADDSDLTDPCPDGSDFPSQHKRPPQAPTPPSQAAPADDSDLTDDYPDGADISTQLKFPPQAPNPPPQAAPATPDPPRPQPAAAQPSAPQKPVSGGSAKKQPAPDACLSGPLDASKVDQLTTIAALRAITDNTIDVRVAEAHLESVLAGVTDPLERMLRESFVLVHYSATWMEMKAAGGNDAQQTEIYNIAVSRLLNQERQLATTISQYRNSQTTRKASVQEKQKAATDTGKADTQPADPLSDQGKLGDKARGNSITERPVAQTKEPAPGSGGNDQRPTKTTVAA